MQPLKLELRTFDVGMDCADPEGFATQVTTMIRESWESGAEIVALPEFTWMGLERFVDGVDKPRGVAHLFWNHLWPMLQNHLSTPDRAAVLGSVPYADPSGALYNRAPILNGPEILYQDKLHLTPWENDFSGGPSLRIWNFRNIRIAVVICLDIEIAEISAALRGRNIDLLLVPSATESLLGVERIGRCASARAVELGCHVAVCHLVGTMQSTLIDENIGRLAAYHPSQSPFLTMPRAQETPVIDHGIARLAVSLDIAGIRALRAQPMETDPSKIHSRPIPITEP